MDSNDEESKTSYENENSILPLMTIFNKFPISSKDSKGNIIKDKIIYICGKMFSHTLLAKYNFPACDFYIYIPENNNLYHSIMNSEDCFSNSLKWNHKLFGGIRDCLSNSEINFKKYYFAINNSNTRENSSKEKEREKDEIGMESNSNYLELHFFVKKRDIVVFRLLLEEIIINEPNLYFISQLIELDNKNEEELNEKKKKKYRQDKEIKEIEDNIKNIIDDFEKNTKQNLIKFNLLNKSKIEEEKRLKMKLYPKKDKKK
jgi:hypothetical protein